MQSARTEQVILVKKLSVEKKYIEESFIKQRTRESFRNFNVI